jgi:hypothetical protein
MLAMRYFLILSPFNISFSNLLIYFSPSMASVEVSKLSNQEKAELACTYAALILHDDEQDITGTINATQVTRSANSSLLPVSRSRNIGLKYSPRLLKAKTSVLSSTSEAQLPDPLKLKPLLPRRKLPRRKKRSKLPHHPRRKKRRWTWATSSDDCLVTYPQKLHYQFKRHKQKTTITIL